GANVQRVAPVDEDAERIEGVRELDAAAPDVGMIRDDQRDVRIRIDLHARFDLRLAINADLAGQYQRVRALARRGQALFDEEVMHTNTWKVNASARRSTGRSAAGANRRASCARGRLRRAPGTRGPSSSIRRGRTTPDTSACPPRHPSPQSCRDPSM